ncbi:SLATT domain-containing protein (plasmid) [Lysinibacillus sp. fkY74-1]
MLVQSTETKKQETESNDIEKEEHTHLDGIKGESEKTNIEENSTKNIDNTLLTVIKEIFTEMNKSEKHDSIILNEIKDILVGLTTIEKSDEKSDKETNLINEITHFKDNRVWVTKKTRMESEARMNSNNVFSLFVVNFYTLIVLALSILGLVISDKDMVDKITVLTLISSVALFGISLFVSLFSYKEKAIAYKQCYLDLTRIESQCQDLLLDDLDYQKRFYKFNEIKKEYNHILEKTDNHSYVDRLIYLKNNKKLNTPEDQSSYKKYKFTSWTLKISIFIIPFIALVLLFIWK